MKAFVVVAMGTLALTARGAVPYCGLGGLSSEEPLSSNAGRASNPLIAGFTEQMSLARKGEINLDAATPTLKWLEQEAHQLKPDRPDSRTSSQRGKLWALREFLDQVEPTLKPAARRQLLEATLKEWRKTEMYGVTTLDSNEAAQIIHLLNWPETGSANISSNPLIAGFTRQLSSLKREGSANLDAPTPTLDWFRQEASQLNPNRPDSRKNTQRGNLWALREFLDQVGKTLKPAERRQLLEATLKGWREGDGKGLTSLDNNEAAQILHLLSWPDSGSANIPSDPLIAGFTEQMSLARKGEINLDAATPTLKWLEQEAHQLKPDRPDSRTSSQRGKLWALREFLDQVEPTLKPAARRQLLEATLKEWRKTEMYGVTTLDSNEAAQIIHLLNWPETGSANISSNPLIAGFTRQLSSLKREGSANLDAPTPTLDWFRQEASQLNPNRPDSRKNTQRGNLWALREFLDQVGKTLKPAERRQLLEATLKGWREGDGKGLTSLDSNEAAQILHLLSWPDSGSANVPVRRVSEEPGAQGE